MIIGITTIKENNLFINTLLNGLVKIEPGTPLNIHLNKHKIYSELAIDQTSNNLYLINTDYIGADLNGLTIEITQDNAPPHKKIS